MAIQHKMVEKDTSDFNPLISIIIPVFNGANYLKEAIDSALSQTYDNIEILIINDGSTDNGRTEKIVLSYCDRIKYYSKENSGVATALNLGIEKMSGQYFSWLSHDDKYYPKKIEQQVQYLQSHDDKNIILYSDYEVIDACSKLIGKRNLDHDLLIQKPLYGLLRSAIHGCSLLIPKVAFEKCGLFDINLKYTQDYALWFTMYRNFPFIHMPETLIQSRTHTEQDSLKNPEANSEGDSLWIFFLNNLTDEEILSCENRKEVFFIKTLFFLKSTPYFNASKYAQKRAYLEAPVYTFLRLSYFNLKSKLKIYINWIKNR